MPPPRLSWNDPVVVSRFLGRLKPDPESECVLFTGSLWKGWGRIRAHDFPGCSSGSVWVHRYAFALMFGPPGVGNDVHHIHDECQNRHCVNPYHLESIDHTEHGRVSQAHQWAQDDMDAFDL